MVYAELVFETGANSVGCYESKEEALSAVAAHHERALKGEPGGPSGTKVPAERIVQVHLYDKHPNELNPDQTVSSDVVEKELKEAVKELSEGGAISTVELAARIRSLSGPLVSAEEGSGQNSIYKMPATEVLNGSEEGWAA